MRDGISAKLMAEYGLVRLAQATLFSLLFLLRSGSAAQVPLTDAMDFRPDQILVKPAKGISPARLAQFHSLEQCKVLYTLEAAGGLQVVAVPAGRTVPELVDQYRRSGLIEFVEPDYLRHLNLTVPNDPKFIDGTLWGLSNDGQSGGTPHADIEATSGWDIRTSAEGIIVAVLDTGIRSSHEDLAGNMWVSPTNGSHGTNSIAGTTNSEDDEGHGTLMAGVIGAVGNNGKGGVGVAWKVQLMACKCFDSKGASSDSAIIAAIDYARANGARVINASFDATNFGVALSNAVLRARNDEILFVASCGNNSADVDVTPHYPACFDIDNIVSVAYTTRDDSLGRYSNYGAGHVDLAAPGAAIYSCFFTSDNAYLGGASLEGTSYAAAYVSGALALLLAEYPGESYQNTLVRLLTGTDPVPALAGKCKTGGRLNLQKALRSPIQLMLQTDATPGQISLQVVSSPARKCALQSSEDLEHWTSVLTNVTSAAGTFGFTQLLTTNYQRRFYRAINLP